MKTNDKIYIFSLGDSLPQWYLYIFCDIYVRKYHSAINNIMHTLLKDHTILTYLVDTLLNCGLLRIKQQRRRISFNFRYIKYQRRRVIRTNVQERLATLWSPSFLLAFYLQGEYFRCPPPIISIFWYVIEDRKIRNTCFFIFPRFHIWG